jgi:hypothetical protein
MKTRGASSFCRVALLTLLFAPSLGEAEGAVLTSYPTEAALLAVLETPTYETFDQMAAGTIITSQVMGVVFSSPHEGQPDYLPPQVWESTGAASPTHEVVFGCIPGVFEGRQIDVLEFARGSHAFGIQLCDQLPEATPVAVRFDFADSTSQTLFVGNNSDNELTPAFFGVTSDTPILRVTLTAGDDQWGGWEEFGIDNLVFELTPLTSIDRLTWGSLKTLHR